MFWLNVAKTYDKTNSIVRAVLNKNLRGLGFLLRNIKSDYVLKFHGKNMFFNHKVAGCYVSLINGNYTEPETHNFIHTVIEKLNGDINFVDVGANVGEYILSLAGHDRVKNVYAFEPHPECAKTCKINALINGYENKVKVIEKILSEDTAPVSFFFNSNSPNASGIAENGLLSGPTHSPSTLDIELHDSSLSTLLLIDVEGSEPLVLKGGQNFISKIKPLIIFEYNTISKKHFSLHDIKSVLGAEYEIYRLRDDGSLDTQFDNTWNCVAVNSSSDFYGPVRSLLI